jgi:hypothetical protein
VLDDLYLDLLEADDEVALPRYSSISGDISVDSDEDLKALPSAGFRQAFTDRITTYSYFGFVDDGGGGGVLAGPSLVVHDVLCQGTKKEEMLQIFTAIGGILRVQYHVYTQGKKLDKASKAMAFCLTMKSDIIAAGGVAEMSVEEGNKRVSAANKLHEPENDEEAGQESDDAQSPEDDNRFNVKAPDKTNFLQKAFKMSKKVVSAPLSIGVAAGSAVLDVAGGVVKTQTDGLFRKHFPHLAHEALVDSFSCALSKGAIVKQGFLYATANWICFVGTVLEAKLEIPLEEINKFEKANTLVFPTAIEISTFTDEKFLFTSFIARDEALKTLHRLWAESAADLR